MGWQRDLYLHLRDREWQELGPLFERFETRIPLHVAMREATRRTSGDIPPPTQARWVMFLHTLAQIGVESAHGKPWKWGDHIRLRHLAGRFCDDCGGPVIKASWGALARTGSTACLLCEAKTREAAKPPSVCRPVVPIMPIIYFPNVPAQVRAHDQRHLAKAIKARYSIGLSINEIVRQLQRWGPVQIIQRYRQATRRTQIW